MRTVLAMLILGVLWSTTCRAGTVEGAFAGSFSCGPLGRLPPYTDPIAVDLRDGRFEWEDGALTGNWFQSMTGLIGPDGAVLVIGAYRAGEYKPIELHGKRDGVALSASGRAGPRDCKLTLTALPKTSPGAVSGPAPNGPFDLAPIRARSAGLPERPFSCPPLPAVPRDLEVEPFYVDAKGSMVDPVKRAARAEAVRLLTLFERAVTSAGDALLRAGPTARPGIRSCLIEQLDTWARGDALTGRLNWQARAERKWDLAVVALAWLKLRDDGVAADVRARVENWLARTADNVRAEYDARLRPSQRNNHLYWAALAVAATGAAIRQPSLLEWGYEQYRFALSQIRPDGTLELELARGSKALHYHAFALAPLIMIAELASANGIDLYAERDGAIHRLAQTTIAGLRAPALFAKLAGAVQSGVSGQEIDREDADWLEPYGARFPAPEIDALLAGRRPVQSTWMGGDVTLLFARR